MVDGPTEPPQSPAYQAMHAAHERLAEAERQLRWRQSIDEAIAKEEEYLRELWFLLRQEQDEVAALESASLRSIRARFRRSYHDELAAERADVRIVEAEIALRLDAIDAIDASPGQSTVAGAEEAVDQAREDLVDAMTWWRDEHVTVGSHLGLRLTDLDGMAASLRALRREVHEAIDVARLATASLLTARRHLADHPMNAVLDRQGSRPVKDLTKAQRWLLELQAELADLGRLQPPEVDGPAIEVPTLNVGSGDLLDDWIVDNRVVATEVSVDASLTRIRRVASGLTTFVGQLDAAIEDLDGQVWDLLLTHPAVVKPA